MIAPRRAPTYFPLAGRALGDSPGAGAAADALAEFGAVHAACDMLQEARAPWDAETRRLCLELLCLLTRREACAAAATVLPLFAPPHCQATHRPGGIYRARCGRTPGSARQRMGSPWDPHPAPTRARAGAAQAARCDALVPMLLSRLSGNQLHEASSAGAALANICACDAAHPRLLACGAPAALCAAAARGAPGATNAQAQAARPPPPPPVLTGHVSSPLPY